MAEANTAVHGENQVERRLVRPREIAAYALTSYGLNNLTTYVGSTKQYFMMSFLGLSGTAYGTLSTIATVWDALDDPISGIIIDRCRTRWGRLRPFLIFPMPFWAISSILFYIVPNAFTSSQSFIYALVTTIIYGIGFSYLSGWELLLYNITPNTNERSTLIATQKFLNLFTYLPSLVPVFVDFLPNATHNTVTQPEVYKIFAIIFVLIAVAAAMFGGVAYTLLYFMGWKPTGNYWLDFALIVIGLTICGLPNHIMNVCDPLLKGDMFDYLEWENGIRNEGIVNAVSGYVNKLSSSIHAMLSGAVFDWIKFKPQHDAYGNIVPHTNPKVLKGIWGIFCLAPAAARFGYGFSLLLFNVHGERKERMLLELEERRKARVHDLKGELTADEDSE